MALAFRIRGPGVLGAFGEVTYGPQFPCQQIRGPEKMIRKFLPTVDKEGDGHEAAFAARKAEVS